MPLDLRIAASDAQHALVEIDPCDRTEFSGDQTDPVSDYSRAASDVEHSVAIAATGSEDEVIRPRLHNLVPRARVSCRRVPSELPSTRHFFVSRLLVSGWLIVALSARGRHREISGSPTSAGIKRYILTTTASDATAETAQSDFSHSLGILCSAYQIALSTACSIIWSSTRCTTRHRLAPA